MRAIYLLSNREKAAILHRLFPDEIPQLVTFIAELAEVVQEDSTAEQRWNNATISYDLHLQQIREVAAAIGKYRKGIEGSAKRFSEELFGNYRALFTVHATVQFVTVRQHPNQKFTKAIDLLFNP